MPERRRVGPDVDEGNLEFAASDGELIGVVIVQVPAFDDPVVGRALVDVLGHNKALGFDPGLAPQLDHIAAPIQVDS